MLIIRRQLLDLLLPAGLVALPLLVARGGTSGPLALHLNLGPGDSPYVRGFVPEYEVLERVGTHWTTYEATVALPLEVTGGPVRISYRFARVLAQAAVVDVSSHGTLVDHFPCRGGIFQERRVQLAQLPRGPLELDFKVDSHDRRNLGLKMDWVRFDVGERSRIRLRGASILEPAILVALLLLVFRISGWDGRRAAMLTAPWALAAAVGLYLDPWVTHRLLRGLPLALGAFGLVVAGGGRWLQARGGVSPRDLRRVLVLATAAFLLRALVVNHPDFYHSDLRTHARLVQYVQEGGVDFFLNPAPYIWRHGVWRSQAYGETYAFPYSPAFHLPFVFFPIPYDSLLTAMKLYAAALSTAPLILLWAMARRLELSVMGSALMVVIPTYTSRLSFAFMPSLFGHVLDLAFIYWLLGHLGSLARPPVWLRGALLVAACQLGYVSGINNIGLFILALALLQAVFLKEQRLRQTLLILAMGAAGSLVSLALYYRGFLDILNVVPAILHAPPGASHYPIQGWLELAYERTRGFFDGIYPLLTVAGFYVVLRQVPRSRSVFSAWMAAYALLLLGRAKIPDLFGHGHETLFITPLVVLLSGEALGRMVAAGSWKRVVAYGLFTALVLQGFVLQWQSLSQQLQNAL